LTGRPESNFFGAEPDFKGMDYIKYDAMCIGNHEFDKGIEHLKKLKELIKFPFLNANIFKKDGKTLFEPYKIFEMKGFKVAVFGLITEETPFVTTPAYVKDLTFKNLSK
jgi:5'-nucleotidase/UDP-sugar diphosphatase